MPQIAAADRLFEDNVRSARAERFELCGRPIADWRQQARTELLRDAIRYTGSYRKVGATLVSAAADTGTATPSIVMAGHQPTLFHPGVWFKNFALDRVARSLSRTRPAAPVIAINLVIDNDVATTSSIRVPLWDPVAARAGRDSIAYDSAAGGVPYELNRIRDLTRFEGFGDAVGKAISPIVANPAVSRLWPHAVAAAKRCENVSCALAQARHSLEAELGLETLELPLSVACRGTPFAAFAYELLASAPWFRQIYNGSATDYRIANHIRSSAHPVPNLAADGEWIEAPFWIYSDRSPQRRPAWVRTDNGGLEISDRRGLSITVASRTPSLAAANELAERLGPEFKLRPRALATTIYSRLVLSDLFVHGIGGAKYDELGDEIMRRYFAVHPPGLMVVTATMLLPTAGLRPAAEPDRIESLTRQLRRTRFAPESFADEVDLPESLCREKIDLLANIPAHGRRRSWQRQIESVNQRLSERLGGVRQRLSEALAEAKQFESDTAVLNNREYSFCLHELDELTASFDRLLTPTPESG